MGNWRHRPRRFFKRQRSPPSPPSYPLDLDFSAPGFHDDNVPLWEKKFCTLIGRVPWQKIVDTKKSMFFTNVLDWDDSAGKEAIQNAKDRFWADTNGLHCDITFPDQDMYIDEINWNPDIDPELIRDLDSVYFAQDEGEADGAYARRQRNNRNATYSEDNCGKSGVIDNSWENNDIVPGGWDLPDDDKKDIVPGGWDLPDDDKKDMKNTKPDNPWESAVTWVDEDVKNKVNGWNHWDDEINNVSRENNVDTPWKSSSSWGKEVARDNTWGGCDDKWGSSSRSGNNTSWSRKWDNNSRQNWDNRVAGAGTYSSYWSQKNSSKFPGNNPLNPASCNYNQHSRGYKDQGWRDYRRGNAWGSKQQDDSYNNHRTDEFSGGGWTNWNENCRKREGSRLSSYENSGYRRDHHNQSGHSWRSRNDNKRVSFAL